MLNCNIRYRTNFGFTSLLIVISIIFTLQSNVSADYIVKSAEEYREIGYQEQQKGNLNGALTYYNKAIGLGIENAGILNDVGVIYEHMGMPYKAEQHYLKAVKLDSSYLASFLNLGYLYKDVGDLDKSFAFFKKRYELSQPGDSWGDRARDELLLLRPDYKGWVVQFEASRLNQKLVDEAREKFIAKIRNASEHYDRGQIHYKKDRFEQAIDEYNWALRFTPDNPKIVSARNKAMVELAKENIKKHSRSAIQMLESGDSTSAKKEIHQILTNIPNEPNLKSR